ncbi:hypothetical protein H8B15_20580 [Hymenobacter sp. BT507]|uniref:MerR family transcriptional regulator n=1 Tax=Hymenobacter citatus TaxID=2763506 RepID=A0ABR7MQH1_9BACT|nr:chaperone modulator CbpM [Hymenobacter citatus]MBC6613329.1 hypothetical protein [Hymenobacter citatus]
METHVITITYHDCATTYGLREQDLREFVELGLVQLAPGTPDTIRDEPEHLARLARLQHELGLSTTAIDVVLAMRRRMQQLQQELVRQRARAIQLEQLIYGNGRTLDADDYL